MLKFFSLSTNVTCLAPLDRASKPKAPVPANKSKQDLFSISNWSQLNKVSFALSLVGLNNGEALKTIRKLLFLPPIILMLVVFNF